MSRNYPVKIGCIYFLWLLFLLAGLFLGINFIKLGENFLGGGLNNYLKNPFIWAWANFDGEHYLAIASEGYRPLRHFYFPVYPKIIGFLVSLTGHNELKAYLFSGLFVSNVFSLLSIIFFWKLLRVDYKKKFSLGVFMVFLFFPTSFYLVSVYTESLFLFFVLSCFYFARKRRWFLASLLASFAGATRLVGFSLFFALIAEWWLVGKNQDNKDFKSLLSILFLAPLGLVFYMYYLEKSTGDFLIFLNAVEIFGDQRSSSLVILPQVFYRYLFKIIPNLTLYPPYVFRVFLELFIAFIFLALLIYSFVKLRLSYSIYFLFTYIVPTLSGSFSSFPRYVLVIFPAFIMLGVFFEKRAFTMKLYLLTSAFLLFVSSALFFRGYFVS